MRKWIILIALLVLGIFAYNYIYQEHRNIQDETPEFVVTAVELSKEFSNDPKASERKYLNKTIVINGIITEQNENDLILNPNIFCQFEQKITTNDTVVQIKGRVIGYDDLLEEIKLDQCNILPN
ncbi:putative nucleic acid binding protein [Flavobacteriaceae bacterium MAR_2010_72]|nr:putative nucleic acid binding protein [Flavobacteriaceae bacterium MAR_2010_72]TVZ58142.1 putative nucleic acid binding protein [Flavobacteriaceae bacterium MAR_2010_105]